MTREVLVTGIGGICAIGRSPVEIFASAMTGRSGVRAAPHLAFGAAVPVVARAPFDAVSVAMGTRSAPLDRVSALALEAARQALADAGASPADPRMRASASIGAPERAAWNRWKKAIG